MKKVIEKALAVINWEFPDNAPALYERYIQELLLWNRKVGLVKIEQGNAVEDLVIRHLYDSLMPLPYLSEASLLPASGGGVVDIGSGGGFPAIPLAIALPDLLFTLVERSGRKAGFLQNALALLGLAGRVELLQENAETLGADWDLAVCRAFRPLSEALPILSERVRPGGCVVVYGGKASVIAEQLESVDREIRKKVEIIPLECRPGYDSGERHLVILRK